MKKKNNDKALTAFMQTFAEMQETLAALTAHADDHFGWNPDDINWGHVGSANYAREKFNEVAAHFRLPGYEEE